MFFVSAGRRGWDSLFCNGGGSVRECGLFRLFTVAVQPTFEISVKKEVDWGEPAGQGLPVLVLILLGVIGVVIL